MSARATPPGVRVNDTPAPILNLDAAISRPTMFVLPYLSDAADVTVATQLLADHGGAAAVEAAMRAHDGLTNGNVRSFCRWRQIERLVLLLAQPEAVGTVH